MNLNFDSLFKLLFPFLLIVLITYILSFVLFIFLPKSGVDYRDSNLSLDYSNYKGLIYSSNSVNKIQENKKDRKVILASLDNYVLKAVYSKKDNSGWIILEKKTNKETQILEQGDKVDNYTLDKLYKNHVLFVKNNQTYTLELEKNERIDSVIKGFQSSNVTTKEAIVVKNNITSVNRDYLNSYVKNPNKIWDNISINELRKNNQIVGFQIQNIKKDSDFEKLGLKKGDIIKAVNNKVLKSYADAFKIYNNLKDLNYLNIEILRQNQTMELNYEVN